MATVLVTDMVDSTERALEVGDERWRDLRQRHDDIVRSRVKSAGGREIEAAEEGFFAIFDSPARAIRCACAIRDDLVEAGVPVRMGLHTGECQVAGGRVRGVAVQIGARVAAAAAPGEVVVSSTLRDLVAGKKLELEDRGVRPLKGIPGEWRLFAVCRPAAPTSGHRGFRPGGLIGRGRELMELDAWLNATEAGHGGLVLVAGEAGVGKTRLVQEVLGSRAVLVLAGPASERETPPYGPVVGALRAFLRSRPRGLDPLGPLARHLALLLPELGPLPPEGTDRPTLFEAIRAAFDAISSSEPAAVFLDDLQWADDATLELLPALAGSFEDRPLLVIGAYRSDEVQRGHGLRRARIDLRRANRLREVALEPLTPAETAALSRRVLRRTVAPTLARVLYDRTQGVPLFVEELATALAASGRLQQGEKGAELAAGEEIPIPDSVRDAVLLRAEALSPGARDALDLAAVRGSRFELDVVADLAGEASLEEPLALGLVRELGEGIAAFRHALTREAVYEAVPWSRRATLHRRIAERLERYSADPVTVAEHWVRGREPEQARRAFLAAVERSCDVYAHRDAADFAQRALELWPAGHNEAERLATLERLGDCLELCGELTAATRTWQEALERRLVASAPAELAQTHRRLAALYELQGAWDRALASRRDAARAFREAGVPGEAAVDLLAAASNLQGAGSFTPALELVAAARADAVEAGRVDLEARALGLEGVVLTRLGDPTRGLATVQEGLSLALRKTRVEVVAELHDKLAHAMIFTSAYEQARDGYLAAHRFCDTHGILDRADLCLVCLALVLRRMGEWDEAFQLSQQVLTSEHAPRAARVAGGSHIGLIHVLRGETKRARPVLTETFALAVKSAHLMGTFDCALGLARLDLIDGRADSAIDRCRFVLQSWTDTEDGYAAIAPLRWAATLFATRRDPGGASACADALSRIATATGNPEALAALTHALGEIALLEGDEGRAVAQLHRAAEHTAELNLPLDAAETRVREAAGLAHAGEREVAVEALYAAYETANELKARPLMAEAVAALARLGEPVERRLGRKAAKMLQPAGLSAREVDVLRLVASGKTNPEIARELYLSPRTVDMHVRHILRKLGTSSRSEAASKAGELGVIPS